jgi:hypothetical protein
MLPEKRLRELYLKNRERIIEQVRGKQGFFVVNFYANSNVRILGDQDTRAELYFDVPHLLMRETLDVEFNKSLNDYLILVKNHE